MFIELTQRKYKSKLKQKQKQLSLECEIFNSHLIIVYTQLIELIHNQKIIRYTNTICL